MEVEVTTLEEFLHHSFIVQREIERDNNSNNATNHKGMAFRGQAYKGYELLPAIGRNIKTPCNTSLFYQERNLIEMARYKLPHVFKADLLPIDMLSLLQHYGIPTRLLDVTSNPLVALYFAASNENVDGEVFAFEYNNSDMTNYPIFNAIAELYKYAPVSQQKASLFFRDVIERPYFAEQKNQLTCESDEWRDRWIKQCCEKIIFIHATEQIERQKLQQGFYILFPNELCDHEGELWFGDNIKPISKEDKQIKKRIIVKKEGKANIRKELKFIGISEATLFGDNIDIVCKDIVGEFKNRKC